MKYAITNGIKWLSGGFIDGTPSPVLTNQIAFRYEYDNYDTADDVITGLYQNGYPVLAQTLRVVSL